MGTATWTRSDLSIRVEVGAGHVDVSNDGGETWDALSAGEAREMARGLCNAADRVEEALTEQDRTAA